MKRKTFFQFSSTLMANPFLFKLRTWFSASSKERLKNWAGNITYSTDKVFYPSTFTEVQEIIKNHKKIKALGTQHCFNRIADCSDFLLSTSNMNSVVSIDKINSTVTLESGMKYGELAPYLDEKGYAVHNLASLPHISVGGSIMTGTHGSGIKNGNLSTAVTGLEVVMADGSIVQFSKKADSEKFNAVVIGLGAIGVITKITLKIEPSFTVKQFVFTGLPISQLKDNFEKIMSAGYSVSLFMDWQTDQINEVWVKSRQGMDSDILRTEFYGALPATKNLHPIYGLSWENCTEQMGLEGPWFERLPHFKMGFTPSSGKELQSEYFIPLSNAVEAIEAISRLGKDIGPYLLISEIRTIAADNLWMSPCYKQTSVTIHFTWKPDTEAVLNLLPKIEKELEPFQARPHWGKVFTLSPKVLQSRYPKLEDFKAIVSEFDPKGKFKNDFLEKNIYR